MTLRQQLISQLKTALHQLENPPSADDCTVCFDVMDTTFEYDILDLDAPLLGSESEE